MNTRELITTLFFQALCQNYIGDDDSAAYSVEVACGLLQDVGNNIAYLQSFN